MRPPSCLNAATSAAASLTGTSAGLPPPRESFSGSTPRADPDPVTWAVARDLLLQGLTDPAGQGDVQLFPSVDETGRAAVVMELRSPDGSLVTQMRSSDLYRFLTRTLALVPLGTEQMDLDRLVEDLVRQSETP